MLCAAASASSTSASTRPNDRAPAPRTAGNGDDGEHVNSEHTRSANAAGSGPRPSATTSMPSPTTTAWPRSASSVIASSMGGVRPLSPPLWHLRHCASRSVRIPSGGLSVWRREGGLSPRSCVQVLRFGWPLSHAVAVRREQQRAGRAPRGWLRAGRRGPSAAIRDRSALDPRRNGRWRLRLLRLSRRHRRRRCRGRPTR
jgi:hypothetical protein